MQKAKELCLTLRLCALLFMFLTDNTHTATSSTHTYEILAIANLYENIENFCLTIETCRETGSSASFIHYIRRPLYNFHKRSIARQVRETVTMLQQKPAILREEAIREKINYYLHINSYCLQVLDAMQEQYIQKDMQYDLCTRGYYQNKMRLLQIKKIMQENDFWYDTFYTISADIFKYQTPTIATVIPALNH